MVKIYSMKTKEKDQKKLITFELAALFIFSLVLLGHLSVVNFARGYYDHFNVTLADIGFSPQIYDYVSIAPAAFIGSAIVTVLMALLIKAAMRIGDFAGSKTKPSKWLVSLVKKHKKPINSFLAVMDKILRVIFWLVIIVVSVYGVGSLSVQMGKNTAINKTNFSSISEADENIQRIIIYKNDAEIVLKSYDISIRQFVGDFEVISGASYTTRSLKI